jgi:hypothetical protein
MVVTLPDATTLTVHYAGAFVFLPTDTDAPTGTEADLLPGSEVEVQGLLSVDGTLTAETIHILLPAPPVV